MPTFISTSILGAIMIVLGITNMMGNIRSLHWYHRQRVLPENVKPFGRLVGIGNISIGIALMVFGILSFIAAKAVIPILTVVGSIVLIIGAAICLVLSFCGMIKYNKGIF